MSNQFVTLVRHAKSSWKNADQSDHERPLNDRGRHDGPVMAQRLVDRHCIPDLILCSSATRARQTCAFLRSAFELSPDQVETDEALYLASPRTLAIVLGKVPSATRHVMIVAHNPGLETFSEILAGHSLPPMPTLGIRHFGCASIAELADAVLSTHSRGHESADPHGAVSAPATLLFADSPKMTAQR